MRTLTAILAALMLVYGCDNVPLDQEDYGVGSQGTLTVSAHVLTSWDGTWPDAVEGDGG